MTQDAIYAACYRWMRKAWLEGADTGEDPEILQAIEAVYSEEEMDAAVIAELQKPENADLFSAALSEPQPKGTRLTAEARVGSTTFCVGVPERMVIEAAQRAALTPTGNLDPASVVEFRRLLADNAERAAFLESHPGVSQELSDLIGENERLREQLAAVPCAAVGADDARDAANWRAHQEVIRKTTQRNTLHLSLRANINGVYNTRDGVLNMVALNQQIGDPGETVGRTAARYFCEIERAIAALDKDQPPVQGSKT